MCSCQVLRPHPLRSPALPLPASPTAPAISIKPKLFPPGNSGGNRGLTLQECRQMALTRNLDLHAARVDQFTKLSIRDSIEKKVLPHLVFASELGQRDNYGYAFSDVLGQEGLNPNPGSTAAGTGVTNYSVSHERSTWRYSFELNWSPTDAALAYYLTRSSANDTVRAHYQKVRVAQKIIGAVEPAYFRLLSLQERLSMVQRLTDIRRRVADQIEALYVKKLKPVEDCNRARQSSLRAGRIAMGIEEDIAKQRNILASALALPAEDCLPEAIRVEGRLSAPIYEDCLPAMELRAIQNRPEAYEAGLNLQNSLNDLKRTLVKCIPKTTGFWRYTRDKDRFLYNKDWKEVGVRVYFDLLEWLSNLDESKAARSNVRKTDLTGGAVAIGIASQVRAAAAGYSRSLKDLRYAESAVNSAEHMLEAVRAKAASNELNRLATMEVEADCLEEQIDRLRALGEVNAALAELFAAMGTNYNEPLVRR
jgi:outer membrane protein TolC